MIGTNTGHGHVLPRPDGLKARCGGPGLCTQCSLDYAKVAEMAKKKAPSSHTSRTQGTEKPEE